MTHTVARTILEQLGGNRFASMTGAKNFVGGPDKLTFTLGRFPGLKINKVQVKLEPSDTYTMTFMIYNPRTLQVRVQAEVSQVYCDNLQSVFTDATGLRCSL